MNQFQNFIIYETIFINFEYETIQHHEIPSLIKLRIAVYSTDDGFKKKQDDNLPTTINTNVNVCGINLKMNSSNEYLIGQEIYRYTPIYFNETPT